MAKKMNTEIFLKKLKENHPYLFDINDYSETVYVKGSIKVTVKCKEHGLFQIWPRDHLKGMSGCKMCISLKRRQTNLKKYGVENYFQRVDLIQNALIKKYNVKNPGLLSDHIEKIKSTNMKNYGCEWPTQSPIVKEKMKKTNILRYGVESYLQNKNFAKMMADSKIKNGKFTKSNSSAEATSFIKNYIKDKNYEISQCAFADDDLNLHEWGIYHNGRWILYDLVIFENGHRGDKNHIIEILEYHGPFHYTLNEVEQFGNQKAYPWKSNITTVEESYKRDLEKEVLGKMLTAKYTIIRTRDEFKTWHNKEKTILKIKDRKEGDL